MPGLNILGTCGNFVESTLEFSTLTITASLNGTLDRHSEGGTPTVTTDYHETITWSSDPETYTREPFDGKKYYKDGGGPSAGKFWLVQSPCCCKCRWSVILPGRIQDSVRPDPTDAEDNWESTTIIEGDPTPIEESGTIDAQGSFDAIWNGPVITNGGKPGRAPCDDLSEGNYQGITLAVTYTPNALVTLTEIEDPVESQAPTNLFDKQTGQSPPFILDAVWGYLKCEGLDVALSSAWVGHGESSGPEGETTEDIATNLDISVTLS